MSVQSGEWGSRWVIWPWCQLPIALHGVWPGAEYVSVVDSSNGKTYLVFNLVEWHGGQRRGSRPQLAAATFIKRFHQSPDMDMDSDEPIRWHGSTGSIAGAGCAADPCVTYLRLVTHFAADSVRQLWINLGNYYYTYSRLGIFTLWNGVGYVCC